MPILPISSPYGAPPVSNGVRRPLSIATLAALKALEALDPTHVDGNEVLCAADGSRWVYNSSSSATGDDVLVVDPTNAAGRWLRAPGMVDLRIAIGFGTADGAVLLTLPAGARMLVRRCYWEVTTAFEGGSSSAIGLAGPSPHNTAGDLLGGAGGDVEATLTAGVKLGTVGADIAAGVMLKATETVTFERITSAFTAGAGFVHIVGELVLNPGA